MTQTIVILISIVSISPLSDDEILVLSKLRAFADYNFNVGQMVQSVFYREEDIAVQGRFLRVFNPFSHKPWFLCVFNCFENTGRRRNCS